EVIRPLARAVIDRDANPVRRKVAGQVHAHGCEADDTKLLLRHQHIIQSPAGKPDHRLAARLTALLFGGGVSSRAALADRDPQAFVTDDVLTGRLLAVLADLD